MLERIIFFLLTLATISPLSSQNDIVLKLKKIRSIDAAIVASESELKKADINANPKEYFRLVALLASKYNTKSRFSESKKLLESNLQKPIINKFLEEKAYLKLQLANCYKFQTQNLQALKEYLSVNELFSSTKDSVGLLRINIEMAEYFRRTSDYSEAEKYINKGFKLSININKDSSLLMRLYGRASAIKNETNRIDSSIYLSFKALKIARMLKDSLIIAQTLNELGFSYKNKSKIDSSAILYQQAENIYEALGDDYNLVHVMNNRAMLYAHNNYPKKEVEKLYFKIIKLVETKKLNFDISSVYRNLSTGEVLANDSSKAFFYFMKFHDSYLKNISIDRDIEISKIKEQYNNKQITEEIRFISDKLKLSELAILQKNRLNKTILISLIILIIFLVVIVVLMYRLNNAYKLLKTQNKEKDALIQEVHHRVKNNLQLISAMLKMQLNSIPDEDKKTHLSETTRRINAMSLVHEMLYNKNTSEHIVMKEYLIELLEKLKELVIDKTKPIQFNLELDSDVEFNITNSVAIGMITSEIISNAIKHAFKSTSMPTIDIKLKNESNSIVLYSVKDNGEGLIGKSNKSGLGTRLIDIFSRQIEAEYEVVAKNGVEYNFKIPYNINE
jgi:two-component system, sensor histidine kinase PdtaS